MAALCPCDHGGELCLGSLVLGTLGVGENVLGARQADMELWPPHYLPEAAVLTSFLLRSQAGAGV